MARPERQPTCQQHRPEPSIRTRYRPWPNAALIQRLDDFDFQTGIVADVAKMMGTDLGAVFEADQPKAERLDKTIRDQVIEAVTVLKASFPGS